MHTDTYITKVDGKVLFVSHDPNSELIAWSHYLDPCMETQEIVFEWWKKINGLDYKKKGYKIIQDKEFRDSLNDNLKVTLHKLCGKGYTWPKEIPEIDYIIEYGSYSDSD